MRWSGTTRRLLVSFSSLVAVFGTATFATLRGLEEMHEGLHRVEDQEQGVRAALLLGSAVRDQYAHQAHTIILGNESHLRLYSDARSRVLAILDEVRRDARGGEETLWVDEMDRASRDLDAIFGGSIVPAVLRGDRAVILEQHARAQEQVALIEERADRLANRFEARIGGFAEHAQIVQHRAVAWALALLVGATLLAAAIGIYVARSVARPVAILEAGAARLAQGDLDARIEITGPAEFTRLAGQWNRMTTALKDHQRRLVESEKLASVGRVAAGIAHEINNPLGVILGYTRLILHRGDGALVEDLRIIEDETLRCQEIVEGLLDLSRPPRLQLAAVELGALCEEVAARIGEVASLPRAAIHVASPTKTSVRGDLERLRQVVFNLVKNAVAAAGADGSVSIRVARAGQSGVVTVEDSGPGLTQEDHAHLFEPFYTTRAGGTGLGLPLSHAIARAHGGTIEAGASPAGGALFILTIPLDAGASA